MAHPWCNLSQRLNAERKASATAALEEVGDSDTIKVNAINTQTGAQFLKYNAGDIAQTIMA
jgi:hypothetical protein